MASAHLRVMTPQQLSPPPPPRLYSHFYLCLCGVAGKFVFISVRRIVLFRDIFMVILFTMKSYHPKSRIMLVVSIYAYKYARNRVVNVCVYTRIIWRNIESPEHVCIYIVCVCVGGRRSEPNRAFTETVLFFYALRKKMTLT
jgi:hypothetical protein